MKAARSGKRTPSSRGRRKDLLAKILRRCSHPLSGERFASDTSGPSDFGCGELENSETWAHATIVRLAPKLKQLGIDIQGVRIDSGDLGLHARKVRAILDEVGLREVRILASGNLDEYILRNLIGGNAPIDAFGVGTRIDTSCDAPYLDCAYKLQEYAGRPHRKRSKGKTTWPGREQVYRSFDRGGYMIGDVLTLGEDRQDGDPLLIPMLRSGKRLDPPKPLSALRERAAGQLACLPDRLRTFDRAAPFEVKVADALRSPWTSRLPL